MESRKQREKSFHDAAFATGARRARAGKFYSIASASRAAYRDALLARRAGGRALEYGCGQGSQSLFLAASGTRVVGIDLSTVGLAQARAAAEEARARAAYSVMDAERLAFPDETFDTVCGSSILHHLDLERAYPEIARVLKPGGAAVFLEPLGHNPAINLYRRVTPELRTTDEHPLRDADLRSARAYFDDVRVRFFHLVALAAVPLRYAPGFHLLLRALDGIDRALFAAFPPSRRWAWRAVIEMSNPKTKSGEEVVARSV